MPLHVDPPLPGDDPDLYRGLYLKWTAQRVDSREASLKHAPCYKFVLDLNHDPCAAPALRVYAQAARAAGYWRVALDLEQKLVDHGYFYWTSCSLCHNATLGNRTLNPDPLSVVCDGCAGGGS